MTIPFARIPAPAPRYDVENEAQFRALVERILRRLIELLPGSQVYTKAEVDALIDAIVDPTLTAADIGSGTFPGSYVFANDVQAGSLSVTGPTTLLDTTVLGFVKADELRLTGSAAATTLGAVVASLPIYSNTGTLLGYLPIYDTIT